MPPLRPPTTPALPARPPALPLQALKHRPLTEIWLLLPALSRWQWHPFSVASGGGEELKLHIKQYGRFTKVGDVGGIWVLGLPCMQACHLCINSRTILSVLSYAPQM